jgi:hypothetical protein
MGRTSDGVLAIVAASICLFFGYMMLSHTLAGEGEARVIGVLELSGGIVGLTAGTLTLKGKMFNITITGMTFTLVTGCVLWIAAIIINPYLTTLMFLFYGVLISLPAAVAIVLIAMSRREFTS